MGNNTPIKVYGRGSIDVDDETFHNIICVLSLSTNLLSTYYITHFGYGMRVELTPDSVVISEMNNSPTIVVGKDDHQSQLYLFSIFVPKSPFVILLTHFEEVSRF
jgi:hypothetical protein